MKTSYEPVYLSQSESLKIEQYTHTSKCSSVNWHVHPEYEIAYIKNGDGSVQIDSYYENYADGLLVFLGPNIPHMPFGNYQLKNNKEIVIQFPEKFVTEKLGHFPEFDTILKFITTSQNGILFSSETHKRLSPFFLKLKKQNNTERLLNFITILYHLSIAPHQKVISKNKPPAEINKHSLERISKIYQYINDHYSENIQSETLAKKLGLTPNSFCRMFKSATSRNFIDFLNEFRIKKAKEHLKSKDITVSEAMYQCGFNDPSYFSRQFKKYTGTTPSKYTRQFN